MYVNVAVGALWNAPIARDKLFEYCALLLLILKLKKSIFLTNLSNLVCYLPSSTFVVELLSFLLGDSSRPTEKEIREIPSKYSEVSNRILEHPIIF